jgi:predicted RNA-binding protein with RPS1 domain
LMETANHLIEEVPFVEMQQQCNALIVSDEKTAKLALSMALQARKLEQTLEKSRVEITRPHVDFQRAVNKMIKDFQARFNSIENSLKDKMMNWMVQEQENPFSNIDAIRVEDGSFYVSKKWEHEITDVSLIPRDYLVPNESAIKRAIADGIRNIPGVNIKQIEQTSMRVKNEVQSCQ